MKIISNDNGKGKQEVPANRREARRHTTFNKKATLQSSHISTRRAGYADEPRQTVANRKARA